jgi:hypothetical protein
MVGISTPADSAALWIVIPDGTVTVLPSIDKVTSSAIKISNHWNGRTEEWKGGWKDANLGTSKLPLFQSFLLPTQDH